MTDAVKSTRRYDSPRRREQAAATRVDILRAAEELFAAQGYAGTTMSAIAAGAGVSLKTVYVAFETKAGVLRALWNARLRGDEGDAPIAERRPYLDVLEEPDPAGQLRLNARNSRAGKIRLGAVIEVLRSAAAVDGDIEELWARIGTEYLANQRAIVESLAEKGALRPGLDVDRAADILWAINHPTVWQLLAGERGWTPEQYEEWSAAAACRELLTPR